MEDDRTFSGTRHACSMNERVIASEEALIRGHFFLLLLQKSLFFSNFVGRKAVEKKSKFARR